MNLINHWKWALPNKWSLSLAVFPSIQKRILTSATDAVTIPDFTGISNPVKLDFSEKDNALKGLKTFLVKGDSNDKFDLTLPFVMSFGQ